MWNIDEREEEEDEGEGGRVGRNNRSRRVATHREVFPNRVVVGTCILAVFLIISSDARPSLDPNTQTTISGSVLAVFSQLIPLNELDIHATISVATGTTIGNYCCGVIPSLCAWQSGWHTIDQDLLKICPLFPSGPTYPRPLSPCLFINSAPHGDIPPIPFSQTGQGPRLQIRQVEYSFGCDSAR